MFEKLAFIMRDSYVVETVDLGLVSMWKHYVNHLFEKCFLEVSCMKMHEKLGGLLI